MEKISVDGRFVPTINGGHGSGNFGHSGRPGKVGGSGNGQGKIAQTKGGKAKSSTQESATAWMKKNISFPEDVTKTDMDFDEIMSRMANGEDFYEFTGITDSMDREKVFDEISKRTGLNYDDVYNLWLDRSGNGKKYADELVLSPRMRKIRKSEYGTKNYDEARLRDMVHSVWAYDGDKDSNKYLHDPESYTKLSDKERKKVIDDEWKYLDEHCVTRPAGMDDEGLSYVSTQYRPSEAKKRK